MGGVWVSIFQLLQITPVYFEHLSPQSKLLHLSDPSVNEEAQREMAEWATPTLSTHRD